MTAGSLDVRPGQRSGSSVRGRRLRSPTAIGVGLLILVIAAVVVDGARGFLPAFPRGDLLYHWALTHAIMRGELPPGGPYAGLPAYYPPGFHVLLAVVSAVTGISVPQVTLILGFLWLPVLPIGMFLLARHVSGRGDVALTAAAIALFAGGYDVSSDRLWVNSLFLVGHEAYPLYPRDIVFGVLPFAVLAFIRALEGRRGWHWAVLSGGLLAICALVQVQLLLPIPFALIVVAVAAAAADRGRRRPAAVALVVTGGITALMTSLWLVPTLGIIRRNGGVSLDSAETLLPARIGFWDLPREFGLLLPLAIVGIGAVLIHIRQRDPAVTSIRPRSPWSGLVLVPWFAVPWVLAVLYDPGWPLEDALRPQRLWLLASQPGAILAAIGLWAIVAQIVERRWHRPRWRTAAVVAVVLAMSVVTVAFTQRQLFQTWLNPEYAALRLDADHVPDMAAVLGDTGPRTTVLTYEDWSSLAWYQTGSWVVAVKPPGYAKLAFDPAVFTGHSQAERRVAVARAFDGDPADLTAVADEYDASQALLARRGERLGLIHQVAAIAAEDPARIAGATRLVDGNGWDAVGLEPGGRLVIIPARASGPIGLEIKVAGRVAGRGVPARRFTLLATGPGGDRPLADLAAPATTVDDWQVVPSDIVLNPGEAVAIVAVDPITVQSVLGFVPAAVPAGWHVARQTADAVVLDRDPG